MTISPHYGYAPALIGLMGSELNSLINSSLAPLSNAPKDFDVAPGCFAAGTLVHTKEGLVTIEKIKVGDWVLSKQESGQGEREYKRVTKTFVHDEQEVMVVTYGDQLEDGSWWADILIATLNHPFWTEGKGWIEARGFLDRKHSRSRLEALDHAVTKTYAGGRTYVTDDPNHIWFPTEYGSSALQNSGDLVDIRTAGYVLVDNPKDALDRVSNPWSFFHSASKEGTYVPTRKYLYRCTVYNLEVEDFHTYYVGKHGVWVHNSNLKVGENRIGSISTIPPSVRTDRIFSSQGELLNYIRRNDGVK